MRHKQHTLIALLFISALHSPLLWAYGGGGGSTASCPEPKFYDESPAKNSVITTLTELSIVASDNTDTSTLDLQINGQKLLTELSPMRSGEWLIHAKLPQAIDLAGKVRVTLEAKSKEGCSAFHPYYLEVSPGTLK